MRWSKTMELYPLAMQTSELGVLRSMISVEATLFGRKLASLLNHTPEHSNHCCSAEAHTGGILGMMWVGAQTCAHAHHKRSGNQGLREAAEAPIAAASRPGTAPVAWRAAGRCGCPWRAGGWGIVIRGYIAPRLVLSQPVPVKWLRKVPENREVGMRVPRMKARVHRPTTET